MRLTKESSCSDPTVARFDEAIARTEARLAEARKYREEHPDLTISHYLASQALTRIIYSVQEFKNRNSLHTLRISRD